MGRGGWGEDKRKELERFELLTLAGAEPTFLLLFASFTPWLPSGSFSPFLLDPRVFLSTHKQLISCHLFLPLLLSPRLAGDGVLDCSVISSALWSSYFLLFQPLLLLLFPCRCPVFSV